MSKPGKNEEDIDDANNGKPPEDPPAMMAPAPSNSSSAALPRGYSSSIGAATLERLGLRQPTRDEAVSNNSNTGKAPGRDPDGVAPISSSSAFSSVDAATLERLGLLRQQRSQREDRSSLGSFPTLLERASSSASDQPPAASNLNLSSLNQGQALALLDLHQQLLQNEQQQQAAARRNLFNSVTSALAAAPLPVRHNDRALLQQLLQLREATDNPTAVPTAEDRISAALSLLAPAPAAATHPLLANPNGHTNWQALLGGAPAASVNPLANLSSFATRSTNNLAAAPWGLGGTGNVANLAQLLQQSQQQPQQPQPLTNLIGSALTSLTPSKRPSSNEGAPDPSTTLEAGSTNPEVHGKAVAAQGAINSLLDTEPARKPKATARNPKPPPAKKRRTASAPIPAGAMLMPPWNERERHPLGVDEDHNWLSEFQCFARAEMMEVFQANKADVVVRSTSKSVKLNQVGVRCRFCAHVPHADRVNRSSAFPSGLAKIYQSFNMMVRDHFAHCSEIPEAVLKEYLAFKAKNSQGACDSRHYWYYAAKKLGLVDTDYKGIERNDETQAAALGMPSYGTTTEDDKSEEKSSDQKDESTKKEPEEEDLSLIQQETGEAGPSRASPFLSELLSHLQMVRLQPAERVGKRKTLPIGLAGFGCRYCYKIGRLGFSRCYPLRRRGLSAQIFDMHLHLQRCTVCPKPVQTKLKELEPLLALKPKANHPANKKSSKGYLGGNVLGEETEFMDAVWARLGRTNDLTT